MDLMTLVNAIAELVGSHNWSLFPDNLRLEPRHVLKNTDCRRYILCFRTQRNDVNMFSVTIYTEEDTTPQNWRCGRVTITDDFVHALHDMTP